MYELDFDKGTRTETITMFTGNASPRRDAMMNYRNVNSCYSKESLLEQYSQTKILVNVHQTDHHHTFEELRVLPALRRGVIVISETVPLIDKIPYSDYIIWTEYEHLTETVKEVQSNYEYYHNVIFGDGSLRELMHNMEAENEHNMHL
jgi:hypothetical protein